jgi:hypothetical protein
MVASLTATTMATFATAGNAAPSLVSQHVLHVFPSFGVGGVPLRMVRIINHFGKRFRHTVIALDNNFEAAGGLAGDLDLVLSPVRALKRGALHTVLDSALVLRRMHPDLLITYNWGGDRMGDGQSPVAGFPPYPHRGRL